MHIHTHTHTHTRTHTHTQMHTNAHTHTHTHTPHTTVSRGNKRFLSPNSQAPTDSPVPRYPLPSATPQLTHPVHTTTTTTTNTPSPLPLIRARLVARQVLCEPICSPASWTGQKKRTIVQMSSPISPVVCRAKKTGQGITAAVYHWTERYFLRHCRRWGVN